MDFNAASKQLIDNMGSSDNCILKDIAKLEKVFLVVDTCEFDPVTFEENGEQYCCLCCNGYDAKEIATRETSKRTPRFNQCDIKCMELTVVQAAGFVRTMKCGIAYSDGNKFHLIPVEKIRPLVSN